MAISWTLVVLGALLHGMQCNADDTINVTLSTVKTITEDSTKATTPLKSLGSTISSALPTASPTLPTPLNSTILTATLSTVESTKPSLLPTTPSTPPSSTDSTTPTAQPTTKATSLVQTGSSSTLAMQSLSSNPPSPSQNGLFTTQIQPTTAGTTAKNSPQNSATAVITTDANQGTTNLNKPTTTTSTEVGTTQLLSTQKNPSAVSGNTALPVTATSDSKSTASQSLGTTKAQTTTASLTTSQLNKEAITTSTSTPQKPFNHSIDLSSSTEENIVHRACKTLGQKMKGNCTVTVTIHGKQLIATVIIDADQEIPPENYESPVNRAADNHTSQKEDLNKDTIPDTLIAILASCGALVLILCCFAAYCTYHRRSYRKNQQHLTEELQTVENGYHDNPTLEVMEVQPEMQEKKLTMNGEFNDSWIVPIDNLLKEDIPDEEDTHL